MSSRASRRRRAVTLADVARYAGVSSAVVSYVINDGPRPVAPATAERVRSAITALSYRPNSHARALRSGSTGILGLIHPGSGNPFFGEYNDVLYQAANGVDVALLTASSNGQAEEEQFLIERLARRNVDGIVVVSSMTTADVPSFRDPDIPILFLDSPFPIPGYTTIGPNGLDGARRAVEHLIEAHHHTQVAFIAGDTGTTSPDDRELGWLDAHRSQNRAPGPMIKTIFSFDGGYRAATELLSGLDHPTAIFVASDVQATGALHAIHDQSLRIPDDVAVVAFDGTAGAAHTWPPLTLVQQPLQVMAEAAITTIVSGASPTHTLYDMELIVRQSCGCQAAGTVRETVELVGLIREETDHC